MRKAGFGFGLASVALIALAITTIFPSHLENDRYGTETLGRNSIIVILNVLLGLTYLALLITGGIKNMRLVLELPPIIAGSIGLILWICSFVSNFIGVYEEAPIFELWFAIAAALMLLSGVLFLVDHFRASQWSQVGGVSRLYRRR